MSIAPPPQEIGDPDARQHGVEARGKGLGFRRCRFLDRRDLQHALVEHDIGQQAALCLDVGSCQPLVEESTTSSDKTLEVDLNRNRQGAPDVEGYSRLMGLDE